MLTLALRAADGGEFQPPSINDTHLPEILPWGVEWGEGFLGKNGLVLLVSVVVIWAFFSFAIRRQSLVPTRMQFIGESIYAFVRNSLGRDILGEKHFKPWIPFLFAIFTFILVNNLMGAIPVIQMPSFSHAGPAYVMAGIVYFTWIGVGIQKHGLRYFKLVTIPSGVPWYVMPVMIPLEIISNFIVRPLTHSLRVMAVMLAGHMIVMIAAAGSEFLVTQQDNIFLNATGIIVLIGFVPLYFLELLLMVLQAFVFALLTAIYLQGAIEADAH
ncbi:F0F1 ATP synthase subunit A [Nesterenkonia flava]|uniref:ATP synthase subunit a n=1 Tax=Nesterenkonia flava TaxID=469799 RepID=A0ABU1FTB4_9MICC|nr:F0F1 ATP synthase subunit A [Nesterenkonia flava]MDR5711472.1 F0F1 ATP synthase subunit A [Nesterenkonia flava]